MSNKNITLRAEGRLIEEARQMARDQHTSLNAQFRLWLEEVGHEVRVERAMHTVKELQEVLDSGGRRFSRDEMNQR
jgi:hypothetical protein